MSTSTIVHNQWRSRPADQRFTSLHDMRAFKAHFRSTTAESVGSARSLAKALYAPPPQISTDELVLRNAATMDYAMTNWSFGQLCSLAKVPRDFMRELPSQLVRDNLIWMLRNREESVKVYLSNDPDMRQMLAFTGPNYGRIHDGDVIDALIRIAGDGVSRGSWRVPGIMGKHVEVTKENTTLYASDRDMFVFLCDEDHPIELGKTHDGLPDTMFRGFYVRNSEVGASSLELGAFLYRGLCCNRIIWGMNRFEKITVRHTALAPERFANEVMPALRAYAAQGTDSIRSAVDAAKRRVIAENEDDALEWLAARELSARDARRVVTAIKDEEFVTKNFSVWDMTQGVTAVARSIDHSDKRLEFEKRAGVWLDKVAA